MNGAARRRERHHAIAVAFVALALPGAAPAEVPALPLPAGSLEADRLAPGKPSSPPIGFQPASVLAQRWLSNTRCREIFLAFHDATGRPLQQVLDGRGETPETWMAGIVFAEQDEGGRCNEPGVLATTTPGHRVVRLCGRKFTALARRNLPALAVVILHEELHSLGLGEDPPTSQEISPPDRGELPVTRKRAGGG